jgi:hypothetical protein
MSIDILLDYIGGLMVKYKFDVKSELSEITANHNFQETCFDSIREGNPLMVDVKLIGIFGDTRQITCLEYILDAVSSADASNYIDSELFENLAHPTINLDQNLCHIPGEDNTVSTCIPKIVDSYIAVSNNGYRLTNPKDPGGNLLLDRQAGQKKASDAMRKIVSKYPRRFQDTSCRAPIGSRKFGDNRDYLTCFEKIMRFGVDVDFIDTTQLPDDFFDVPMCLDNETRGGLVKCYKKIIMEAASTSSSTLFSSNAKTLLYDMIRSKKFEYHLYSAQGTCGNPGCIERLFHPEQTPHGYKVLKTLLDTYSDSDGVLDLVGESSPFSGKKCMVDASSDNNYESCINTVTKSASKLFLSYAISVQENAIELLDHIANQPQFSDKCGSLKLLSLVAPTDGKFFNAGDIYSAYINKLSNVAMSDNQYLEPLRTLECMSDVGGNLHKVGGIDYALELGSPITYQTYANDMNTTDFLAIITKEPCTSIRTGENISCLEKLTKELLVDYSISDTDPVVNPRSVSIINYILDSSDPNAYKYIYPEGETYFTDYLTESLFHAITVKPDVSKSAIGILEHMINRMGVHFAETGKRFKSDTYPRLGRILDIIEEAPRRWGGVSAYSQKFEKPSDVKYFINNCFTRTKEDVNKAIRSGLFEYGKVKSSIDVLSQWFDEYGDSPEIVESVEWVMERTRKQTLMAFFKAFNNLPREKPRPGRGEEKLELTPQIERLFEHVYKKPMVEFFKPSLESRILYDELCFSNPKADNHDFLEEIYDDVSSNSTLQTDTKNIVGVYDVSVGDTGLWGDDHILQYANAISRILYGSSQPIGEPYIIRSENMRPVPVGLIEAVNNVSEFEFIGKRTDNVKGKLGIEVYPKFNRDQFGITDSDNAVVRKFRSGDNTDFTVMLHYRDENGFIIDQNMSQFKMLDALQKLPKKLKTKIQIKYPYLFGQLDAVLAKEAGDEISSEASRKLDTYKLVISNKPTDIIRSSACQGWDTVSCMTIFGGSHNESLRDYLNSGSYIAYLTKNSEYEPQWLARLFMHKCDNCNCVSIQDRLRYYEINRGEGRNYPNWHILYDAVKIALADKGINNISGTRGCEFAWGENVRENIEENGDPRCDEEMDERRSECIGECENDCGSDHRIESYLEDISDEVQGEINDRVADARKEHIDDEGELTISESKWESIIEDIEQEVRENLENNLLDEKITECKDECDNNCDNVNEDFDCYHYLSEAGLLDDEDSEVWTDTDTITRLARGNESYKGILLERTGQTESSMAFVKPVSSMF